jgi:hypothetical protein
MARVAVWGVLALSAAIAAIPASAAREASTAACRLWSRNAIEYDGPCIVRPERGGSFSLTFPHSEEALDLERHHVARIRVRMVRPGVAEVSVPDLRGQTSGVLPIAPAAAPLAGRPASGWSASTRIIDFAGRRTYVPALSRPS